MAPHDLYATILDQLDQGVLVLDEDRQLIYMNEKGRDIIGLSHREGPVHPAGYLERGDLVLLIDYPLGADDGGLSPSDLQLLGLSGEMPDVGDYLLLAGIYGGSTLAWEYGTLRPSEEKLLTCTTAQGHHLRLRLDRQKRLMDIAVNNHHFPVHFLTSYGHMVVLDPQGELKFIQSHGYTIRKESIATLLRGGSFQAKGKSSPPVQFPLPLHDVIEPGRLTHALTAGLAGEPVPPPRSLLDINKRLVFATIKTARDERGRPCVFCLFSEIVDVPNAASHQPPMWDELTFPGEAPDTLPSTLVAESLPLKRALQFAFQCAPLDYPLLFIGESGTGKRHLARELHEASGRTGPFVALDLLSVREDLMLMALFGDDVLGLKGALDQARNGTLYLRGLDRLPGHLQGALVEYYHHGDSTLPRLIVASHQDLLTDVKEGILLEDLYQHLATFTITLPPLRALPETILPLATRLAPKPLSSDAMEALMRYEFPGNVAELKQILTAAGHVSGDIITAETLHLPVSPGAMGLKERLRLAEKTILEREWERTGGDKKRMMAILDISKTSLYDKLNDYDIGRS